ncbi:hypothetical protein AYL99_06597 [Fonsecaea erecta]|uniref:DUF1014 domain protein n=1 Tax=Fonsecaea erecta TaxID=1367422 RepID=A0A178ZHL6_9EURO|nr:hypothetical protein AYL99_06597 [Fonsecaea erecta]OAP59299.1 hypothetical protein AYL99_06597 [Fonsecaea erecta]
MPHNPFIFSPTQFIRIFVIVNITTYITTRAYLDSRAPPTPQPRLDEEGNNNNNYYCCITNTTTGRTPTGQAITRTTTAAPMAPKGKGENTRKAAGNARKADAAAQKQAAADAVAAAREEEKWQQGSKDTSKKQAAAAKAAEQAAKKAEREAMLAAEEKGMRDKPKGANKKTAEKKSSSSRGTLDLAQLDGDQPSGSSKERALNASGIDNALDALSLTTGSANDMKLDRHPERRFPAAYKAYEERRLPEIDRERPGLRRNQKIELIKKEFERSDENPFNQAGNVRYDASKEELADVRKKVREGVENRLGEK